MGDELTDTSSGGLVGNCDSSSMLIGIVGTPVGVFILILKSDDVGGADTMVSVGGIGLLSTSPVGLFVVKSVSGSTDVGSGDCDDDSVGLFVVKSDLSSDGASVAETLPAAGAIVGASEPSMYPSATV